MTFAVAFAALALLLVFQAHVLGILSARHRHDASTSAAMLTIATDFGSGACTVGAFLSLAIAIAAVIVTVL